MESKVKSVKTLGTNTGGDGSERYQLVKKMVEAGALSGSQKSLCESGLLIGSETARKYHAALIRDGVIQEKKDSSPNSCNNQKQATQIIIGDEISETQKFDDFKNFVRDNRVRHLQEIHRSQSEHEKIYHRNMVDKYNSMLILLDQFDVNIASYAKRYSYRTGYLVKKDCQNEHCNRYYQNNGQKPRSGTALHKNCSQ